MTWNYRVIRHKDSKDALEVQYALHECYYETDDLISWTENPIPASAETPAALLWILSVMLAALERPVLEEREQGDEVEAREEADQDDADDQQRG